MIATRTPSTSPAKRRRSQRRFSRGAAMVEGGILAPVFAMMMMMNIYLGGVYQTKYKSFMKERQQTWSYVSNACTTSDGDQTEPAVPDQSGNVGQTGDPRADNAPGGADATREMFVGHAKVQEKWDYPPTYRFNGGQAKVITTEGWAVCNEQKYGNDAFGYMANVLKGVL